MDGNRHYNKIMISSYQNQTLGSFKLQFSLGCVTSCYVIMNISIAWTIDKLKIT